MKKLYVFVLSLFLCLGLTNKLEAATIKNKEMKKLVDATKWKFNKFDATKRPTNYPIKPGTILVTPDYLKGIYPTGHTALVINEKRVIEATKDGVVYGDNNWYSEKKYTIGLRVKGLSNKQHINAYKQAEKHLKKIYNINFLNYKTRKSFYCSQLVWSSFYDLFKINLDTKQYGLAMKDKLAAIHPLELAYSSLTDKVFMYDNINK